MKTKRIQIIIGIATTAYASVISSQAQQFQNLDFESPLTTQAAGSLSGEAEYTLPFWNIYTTFYPPNSVPDGVLNGFGGGIPLDTFYGVILSGSSAIDGNQSLGLEAGDGNGGSIFISQTGMVPKGDNSVSFLLGNVSLYHLSPYGYVSGNALDYFSLSINNQNVPLEVSSNDNGLLTVSGSISQWAGQVVSLSIINSSASELETYGVIDDVAFSPVAVPESPGVGLLAASLSLSVVFFNKRKLF